MNKKNKYNKVKLYFIFAALAIALPSLLNFYTGHEGKILIATEKVEDDKYFKQTVIYIFDHSIWGAQGIILNKPAQDIQDLKFPNAHYFKGGPVLFPKAEFIAMERPKSISHWRSQELYVIPLKHFDRISTQDKIDESNIYLGYSGWGSGQLEREIKSGMWVVDDYDPAFIYDVAASKLWKTLMTSNID